MGLFPLTRDIQALLLRATASLDRIDTAIEEVIRLTRNLNEGVSEIRTIVNTVVSVTAAELAKRHE